VEVNGMGLEGRRGDHGTQCGDIEKRRNPQRDAEGPRFRC
jgi:hypothetical protein